MISEDINTIGHLFCISAFLTSQKTRGAAIVIAGMVSIHPDASRRVAFLKRSEARARQGRAGQALASMIASGIYDFDKTNTAPIISTMSSEDDSLIFFPLQASQSQARVAATTSSYRCWSSPC